MKKSILSQIAQRNDRALDETTPRLKRASSPVIANVGRALTSLSEDSIVSLNPDKIDRSPFYDRFDADEDYEKALDELKLSIQSEGQTIPILVRPHPDSEGRYQLAYGFRRLEAIKAIARESQSPEKIKIRAYVRTLSDHELMQEQAVENGVRENLTWIEQAMWAEQLSRAGYKNREICPVLGLGASGVSALLKVARAIPHDIVFAIGRAKGVGRPRWGTLAKRITKPGAVDRVRSIIDTDDFKRADSSKRVDLAIDAAAGQQRSQVPEPTVVEYRGRTILQAKQTTAGTTVTIAKQEQEFADWLLKKMPQLLRDYESDEEQSK